MLREFAAIGLSRYTGQQEAAKLIETLLSEKGHGHFYDLDGKRRLEVAADMGPFQLMIGGTKRDDNRMAVDTAQPALKEKRSYALHDAETFFSQNGDLMVTGVEHQTLERVTIKLTERYRYYNEPDAFKTDPLYVSCYGLSTEGKVLLGIERTQDDLKQIDEESSWRRDAMERALEGDESAADEIRDDEDQVDDEVRERLKTEDVFTVLDGFIYPDGSQENSVQVLGDILKVDKLMNSFSNEWVYYLQLDVLGQLYRVLINPTDLVGQPKAGRRFFGSFNAYGRLDPARLFVEDQTGFY
jgi:hypothetical protein